MRKLKREWLCAHPGGWRGTLCIPKRMEGALYIPKRLEKGSVHTLEVGKGLCAYPRGWRELWLGWNKEVGVSILGACHLGERTKNKKLSYMRKSRGST